jgi:hypothetical protein
MTSQKGPRPYETHSPSSISSFISYRTTWYLSRFLGLQVDFGSDATSRGKAVEEGVNKILEILPANEYEYWSITDPAYNELFMEGVETCNNVFKKEIGKLNIIPDANYMRFASQAIAESIDYLMSLNPVEIIQQVPITTSLDGCTMPIKGYIDYVVKVDNDQYVILDKKTASRSESSLSQAYVIQGAIYHKAMKEHYGIPARAVTFDFSIFLKNELKVNQIPMSENDINYGLRLASKAGQSIEKIKEASELLGADHMKAMFFPDIDSIFKQGERELVRRVFLDD